MGFPFIHPQTVDLGMSFGAREAIENEIERLISLLDMFDGDCDLEENGDREQTNEDGAEASGTVVVMPQYGLDQSTGPTNVAEEELAHKVKLLGLVPNGRGGWKRPG